MTHFATCSEPASEDWKVRSRSLVSVVPFALLVVVGIGAANAAPVEPGMVSPKPSDAPHPDVATLLFSTSQWALAPAGSKITYTYDKKTNEATLGPSFDDHITLELRAGESPATRTTEVKMFSGANAVPAGPFESDKQNPVLLLVLEKNVQELSKSFQANPRYLKNAIRKAWRDNADIAPVTIKVDGKVVDGTRVAVQPFLKDAEAGKMKGLDAMTYTVEVADSIPGYIASIDIHAPGQSGKDFSETLRYAGLKTP